MFSKLLRSGSGSRAVACASALAAALLLWPGAASALSTLELRTGGSELEKSFYQPDDTNKKSYVSGAEFTLDMDFSSGTIEILDFFLPGAISSIGMDFSFTSVPSHLTGAMTMLSPNEVAIVFPDVTVDFVLDDIEGTLVFDLTTYGGTIPSGCAGRTSDQDVSGSHLDLTTGELALVGVMCPYEGYYFGNTNYTASEFDSAFRLFVRGTIPDAPQPVPEPGTFAMLGAGLAGLALRGRKRA